METTDKMYSTLFNAITDAVRVIGESKIVTRKISQAVKILKDAQLEAEEIHINMQDCDLTLKVK